jgi:hypothetical protein
MKSANLRYRLLSGSDQHHIAHFSVVIAFGGTIQHGGKRMARWYGAPFASSFSERAQFEALSLFVWAFFMVLVVAIANRWPLTHASSLALLPIFHLQPWIFGLIEYRRLRKLEGLVQSASGDFRGYGAASLQSLIRVLWGAYSTISVVEILAIWR